MSIILGLSAAVCWGVTDFLARYASRELGAYRSLFFMQAFGLGLLSAVWLGMDRRPVLHATGAGWTWAGVAGVLSAAAVLALYRSFETGKLAVVAPISAGYPALTALLAMASGEQVTAGRWAGIALVLAGVGMTVGAAGSTGQEAGPTAQDPRAGVGWALAAAAGFGVMFWLLGFHVVPALGGLMSVWVLRLVATLGLGLAAWPAGQSLRIPRRGMVWMLVAMGALDIGAYLSNNFGMEFRHVSILTVIASLYAAVTVLLAAVVLRERLNWKQWLGVALIFAGVVILSA
ncbi:MAG: DMT family transporter [Acidobacteriota bacterium]|nr:DMT family transporter [Acidobacteriota bacterium]